MFLGTAGYITAHALKSGALTPELGILVGTAGAAGLGVITGLVAIRRLGIYFAMITLALSQLLYFIYLQTRSPMRRRHPGHSAGVICSASSISRTRRYFITSSSPDSCSFSADFPHHQLAVRRGG